ncbi:MAG: hypothetical protein ACFB2Z_05560 [Maricaulaceae bacterium]
MSSDAVLTVLGEIGLGPYRVSVESGGAHAFDLTVLGAAAYQVCTREHGAPELYARTARLDYPSKKGRQSVIVKFPGERVRCDATTGRFRLA